MWTLAVLGIEKPFHLVVDRKFAGLSRRYLYGQCRVCGVPNNACAFQWRLGSTSTSCCDWAGSLNMISGGASGGGELLLNLWTRCQLEIGWLESLHGMCGNLIYANFFITRGWVAIGRSLFWFDSNVGGNVLHAEENSTRLGDWTILFFVVPSLISVHTRGLVAIGWRAYSPILILSALNIMYIFAPSPLTHSLYFPPCVPTRVVCRSPHNYIRTILLI